MTIPSLDRFRRTRQLFIDTPTLNQLIHLHRHYGANLLEVGRLSQYVVVAGGGFTPTGDYTVRVQDDRTIWDIAVFVGRDGQVREGMKIDILADSHGPAEAAEAEVVTDKDNLAAKALKEPPPPKKTSGPRENE